MSWNDVIGSGTALIVALTLFIAAIAGLAKASREAWSEIKKLREGLLESKITLAQLSQESSNQHAAGAANVHVKPDPSLVIRWAADHRAENAYNLGPKNWERCLFDLGYPGGVQHELAYEENGKLKYQ